VLILGFHYQRKSNENSSKWKAFRIDGVRKWKNFWSKLTEMPEQNP